MTDTPLLVIEMAPLGTAGIAGVVSQDAVVTGAVLRDVDEDETDEEDDEPIPTTFVPPAAEDDFDDELDTELEDEEVFDEETLEEEDAVPVVVVVEDVVVEGVVDEDVEEDDVCVPVVSAAVLTSEGVEPVLDDAESLPHAVRAVRMHTAGADSFRKRYMNCESRR